MKTKVLHKQKKKLDFDNNLLNNQNYIDSSSNKNLILNYYTSLKYMWILLNKYIIFSTYTIIFFFLNWLNWFSIFLFICFTPFYWILIASILLFFNINILNIEWFFKNFIKDFFEIKPLIFSYKTIYTSNRKFNFAIIYILYYIIGLAIWLAILFNPYTIHIIDRTLIWKEIMFPFVIIFVLYFVLIYKLTKKFYFKLNILNIFFYPFLMIFLFFNFLFKRFFKQNYEIIKISSINKIFNWFDFISHKWASNKYYKIQQK